MVGVLSREAGEDRGGARPHSVPRIDAPAMLTEAGAARPFVPETLAKEEAAPLDGGSVPQSNREPLPFPSEAPLDGGADPQPNRQPPRNVRATLLDGGRHPPSKVVALRFVRMTLLDGGRLPQSKRAARRNRGGPGANVGAAQRNGRALPQPVSDAAWDGRVPPLFGPATSFREMRASGRGFLSRATSRTLARQ